MSALFFCVSALAVAIGNTKSYLSFVVVVLVFLTPVALGAPDEVANLLSLSMLFVSLGGLAYNIASSKNINKLRRNYYSRPIALGFTSSTRFDIAVNALVIVSVLFSAYYFSRVGIALFASEVGLERLTARHAVPGSYFFQRLFRVFLPILWLILYIQSSLNPPKYRVKMLAVLFVTCAFLLFTGLRGNLVTFIFTPVLICNGFLRKNTGFLKILLFFAASLAAGIYITMLMYEQTDLLMLLKLLSDRLTTLASDGLVYVFYDKVPSEGLLYGQSWINDFLSLFSKLGLTSADAMNYSAQVARDLLGDLYNGEQAAVYIFGEFYANLGYTGVILGSFALGIFLQYIYCRPYTLERSVFMIALFSYGQAALLLIIGGPSLSMAIDYLISLAVFYASFVTLYSISRSLRPSYG